MPPKVVAVAAGEAHTLALTGDGQVYSWGRGPFGRLGTGREDDELVPTAVAPAVSAGGTPRPRFVAVAAGAYHSLALDDEGSLWSWGYNLYGQLGYGDQNSRFPCLVEQFQDLGSPETLNDEDQNTRDRTCLKLSSVKAGGMMSFAIDSLGGLWMWGSCPQQTDAEEFCIASSSIPLPVWDFHGHTVVKVACGNEHVVAAVSVGETYIEGD